MYYMLHYRASGAIRILKKPDNCNISGPIETVSFLKTIVAKALLLRAFRPQPW